MILAKFQKHNKFLMLALDQRGSFKKLMNPTNPEVVTDAEIIVLKKQIIESAVDQFSGLLIDNKWGYKAYENKSKPFLLPLEKSGYTDQAGERVTELEYSPRDLLQFGADGVKLLLYFNPDSNSAHTQLDTGRKAIEECRRLKLPLFLEIVTYRPDGLPIQDKGKVVLASVQKFIDQGVVPDVWKLEYPGSLESCKKLTNLVGQTPWIILTAGAPFEVFKQRLEDAALAGVSGFLAGRALWQEACVLGEAEREQFLKQTYPSRFRQICEILLS